MRTARSRRSLSSVKRTAGRRSRAGRARPGRPGRRRNRSARPSSGSKNMPLMVKSRRWASSRAEDEDHLVGTPAVAVGAVGAKRRDLDGQRLRIVARAEHFDDAEARADGHGAAKQPADLRRAWRWWRRRNPWAPGRATRRARSRRPRAPDGPPLAIGSRRKSQTHARSSSLLRPLTRAGSPNCSGRLGVPARLIVHQRRFFDPDEQHIPSVAALLPIGQLGERLLASLLLCLHHDHRTIRRFALQVGNQASNSSLQFLKSANGGLMKMLTGSRGGCHWPAQR